MVSPVRFVQFTFAVMAEVPAMVMEAASSMVNAPRAPPVMVTSVHVEDDPAARLKSIVEPATFAVIVDPEFMVSAPEVVVRVRLVRPDGAQLNVPYQLIVVAEIAADVAVERHACDAALSKVNDPGNV
jgi:hypothetical protein